MRENAIIWVLLATISVMVAFAVVKTSQTQSHQNDALHSIICFVQYRELLSPTLSAKQKAQSIQFWGQALKSANLPACAPIKPTRTTTTTN